MGALTEKSTGNFMDNKVRFAHELQTYLVHLHVRIPSMTHNIGTPFILSQEPTEVRCALGTIR